jgi:hypothetical protein
MLHNLRFSLLKMPFIHNTALFGSYITHILNTGVLKFKKESSGVKGLINGLMLN